jgi:hypothetical protein
MMVIQLINRKLFDLPGYAYQSEANLQQPDGENNKNAFAQPVHE